LAVASIAGLVFLVRRDRARAKPLLPVDLLGHRPFRFAAAASVFCFVAQSAGQLALPFYLQLELARGALATGTIVACWPLAVALTSPWANRLSDFLGCSFLCACGALILAVGLAAASLIPVHAGIAPLALCAAICGIGFGLFQVPNNRNLFLGAPPDRSAAAGGMQGTARLTGQILGAILLTMLFASYPGTAVPRLALAVAATSALAAALINMRLATSENRPSLQCRI
jgi:DHA2 family multidrug resistance protein-like MFS transporter